MTLLTAKPGWRTCLPAGRIGRRELFFMFFVYAIRSQMKNYIYVGLTNNVERRFVEHNNGENRSTKAYRPFALIVTERFETRIEARKRRKIFEEWDWERVFKIVNK